MICVELFQNYSLVKYSELSTGWTTKKSRFDLLKGQKLFYSLRTRYRLWGPRSTLTYGHRELFPRG
jgi:hypothetical protein